MQPVGQPGKQRTGPPAVDQTVEGVDGSRCHEQERGRWTSVHGTLIHEGGHNPGDHRGMNACCHDHDPHHTSGHGSADISDRDSKIGPIYP